MRPLTYVPSLALALAGGLLWMGSMQSVRAQENNLTDNPGYVDFSELSQWFEAEANIEVNLRGALLNLIANSSREAEPEFSNLLSNLRAIQVRGFPMSTADQEEILNRFQNLANRLESQGWERVVYIREDDESVNIYVRPEGEDSIAGLTVMVANPEDQETVFVNIVGSIRPEEIGEIGRNLDIGPLEDVDPKASESQ